MERIFYANDTVITGSEIARALVDYAGALAARGTSASVEIPVRQDDGSTGTAKFLIGPASQILTETALGLGESEEIVDDELVARFRHEIDLLAVPTAVPMEVDESPASAGDDDYELRPEM